MLCISIIFFVDSLGKASFNFRLFSAIPFVACAKDLVFLWCLDLARMLILGLGEIGEGILNILARLVLLFTFVLGMSFLLSCEATHYRKVLNLSSTRSLSHSEL